MTTKRRLDTILDQMADDSDFARRTATLVLERAQTRFRRKVWMAAAAALLLIVPVFFFALSRKTSRVYPGVSGETARTLAAPTRSDEMWQETDLVITAAFTRR